jgi:uncharacterized protein (DUF1697 family)
MVRSASEVAAINAYAETQHVGPGGRLYVGFLKAAPSSAVAKAVAGLSNEVDTLLIDGRELYWRCTKSFSESTVSGPRLDKLLNVPVTVRNVNTVRRLAGKLG